MARLERRADLLYHVGGALVSSEYARCTEGNAMQVGEKAAGRLTMERSEKSDGGAEFEVGWLRGWIISSGTEAVLRIEIFFLPFR